MLFLSSGSNDRQGGKNLENIVTVDLIVKYLIQPETSRIPSKDLSLNLVMYNKHTEKVLFATVTKIAIEKNTNSFWGKNPSIQEALKAMERYFDANEIHALNTLSSGGTSG